MAAPTGLLPSRYAAPEPVGRGGMGEIYRATDMMLSRTVAVKMLAPRFAQDEAVRKRFTREAQAAARLSSDPHIVTVYDVGEWAERPFIVMEYLPGGSLDDRLRREGAQPPHRVLAWLEQTAAALDAAHRNGVIHRDIKPANLLLDAEGNVSVVDFGIASAAGLDKLTQTGTVLGTAAYFSPEQAQGAPTTAATDRYSLAVVAYELLAGRRPFEADSVAAEAAAHVTAPVPSVCETQPDLPCELDPVFAKALAKNPAQRYSSCAAFVAALRKSFRSATAKTAVIAPPRRAPAPGHRSPRTRWLWASVGVLALAAIGGGAAGIMLAGGKDAAPPAQRQSVVVRTVTQQATTVVETITAAASSAPVTSPTAASPGNPDGHALNDQAYALMQRGDFQAALPLLQQAVQALQGRTDDIYDAYANYNLGVALIRLGRCSEAIPYLETAKQIEPSRHEVQDALKTARRC